MAKYCLIVKALIKECDKEKIPCDTLRKASVMLHKQMQMGNDMIALDSILGYNVRQIYELFYAIQDFQYVSISLR